MRVQYHFHPQRTPSGKRVAWNVHGLIERTRDFDVVEVPLARFGDVIDSVYWFDEVNPPTVRQVALHARLIDEADLAYPIILGADGRVMDGMHRICKALRLGHETIGAVQFDVDPPPDHVDVLPDELDYD